MEVIWELYAGLKGCAVEPRAAFQRTTLASFPLLFNPLIFICSYVKELRWQTKGRFCPFNFFFTTSCNSASQHFRLIQPKRGRVRRVEMLREAFQHNACVCVCVCLAKPELMGTSSWLLPARPPANEAGSLTACKAATVQPLHTLPPLGPRHFHRGTLAHSSHFLNAPLWLDKEQWRTDVHSQALIRFRKLRLVLFTGALVFPIIV